MKAKFDFDPIAPDEVLNLPLDFTEYLAVGDTLNGTPAWNCTVAANSPVPDGSPAARKQGAPTIDTATKTKVVQTISGCVAGAIYVMEAVASTVNGETLQVWAFIECKAAGTV